MIKSLDESARHTQGFFDGAAAEYAAYGSDLHRLYRVRVEQLLEHISCDRPLRLLDLGSGAGIFADLFLQSFVNSTACCIDFSESMLARQTCSDRKRLLQADVRALPESLGQFDVVSIDAVLHHLIRDGGYSATVSGVGLFLGSLRSMMARGGFILIRECYHETIIREELGSRVAYRLSTTQFPQALLQLLRFFGLRAAGGGVCFLSRRQWLQLFEEKGMHVVNVLDSPVKSPYFELLGFKANGDLFYLLRFQ